MRLAAALVPRAAYGRHGVRRSRRSRPEPAARLRVPATYDDLLAALLALAALAALRARLRGALVLVWIFGIEGTVDLLYALYQGLRVELTDYQLGVAWYIP